MVGWNSCIQPRMHPNQHQIPQIFMRATQRPKMWLEVSSSHENRKWKQAKVPVSFPACRGAGAMFTFSQPSQRGAAKCFRLDFVFAGYEREKHEWNRKQGSTKPSWQQSQAQPQLPQPSLPLIPWDLWGKEGWDVMAALPHCLFCRFSWETQNSSSQEKESQLGRFFLWTRSPNCITVKYFINCISAPQKRSHRYNWKFASIWSVKNAERIEQIVLPKQPGLSTATGLWSSPLGQLWLIQLENPCFLLREGKGKGEQRSCSLWQPQSANSAWLGAQTTPLFWWPSSRSLLIFPWQWERGTLEMSTQLLLKIKGNTFSRSSETEAQAPGNAGNRNRRKSKTLRIFSLRSSSTWWKKGFVTNKNYCKLLITYLWALQLHWRARCGWWSWCAGTSGTAAIKHKQGC